MILTIRTDKPEAELGLFDTDGQKLAYEHWSAHMQLAETIHTKMQKLLDSRDAQLSDISGIIGYLGPGSYTGLRIGLSVANVLADSLMVPIVGAINDNWIQDGVSKIKNGNNDQIVLPIYGGNLYANPPAKN